MGGGAPTADRLRAQCSDQALLDVGGLLGPDPIEQRAEAAELHQRQFELEPGGLGAFDQGGGGGFEGRLVVQPMAGLIGCAAERTGDRAVVAGHAEGGHRRGPDAVAGRQADDDGAATAAVTQSVEQGLDHHSVALVDKVAPGPADEIGLRRARQRFAGSDRQADLSVRSHLQQEVGARKGEA